MQLTDKSLNLIENVQFGLLLGRMTMSAKGSDDYIIEDLNPKMASYIGMAKEALIGRLGLRTFPTHFEQNPELMVYLKQVCNSGEPFTYDLHQLSADRWLQFHVSSPQLGYFVASVREVTNEVTSLRACRSQLALEEKHKARYEALIKLMKRQHSTIEALLDDALEEALQLTESTLGYISLYNDENKEFTLSNWSDEDNRSDSFPRRRQVFQLSFSGLWGRVILNNKAVVINTKATDEASLEHLTGCPHPLLRYLGIPVFDGDRIVAVLSVANKLSKYDQFDIYQLTLLMSNIWAVVNDMQAQEKLTYISFHDQLTGLYNRHYFEIEMERLEKSRHQNIALIIGDVNGLKLTNDVFGHLEGDNILTAVSSAIKNACRDEDIVARWGGDEFILLLPNTDERGAEALCQRIRERVNCIRDLVICPSISLGYSVRSNPNESLLSHLKNAEDKMYLIKMTESKRQREAVIRCMQNVLYDRSDESLARVDRVVSMVVEIGHQMGLTENQISELKLFAGLHDIGKIAIPDDVINKPERLSSDEWRVMKKHSEIGYRIANATPELSSISEYILYHHERFDGSGYPKGIKADDIPLPARIFSVVDAYDAMTSNRPYCGPISHESAIKEIRACGGSQFDPDVVNVFMNVVQRTTT